MDAGTNLEAIRTAQAHTEEAKAATAALAEQQEGITGAIAAIFDNLKTAALASANTAEQSHQATAAAFTATEEHLNATPGDHQAVMTIIAAKDGCETATTGMGNVHDSYTRLPDALQELSDHCTTTLAVLLGNITEENAGQINQSVGALSYALTNIASIKG